MRLAALALRILLPVAALTLARMPAEAASDAHDSQAVLSSDAATRAVAVSGPVILVSPLSLDFGEVEIGASETRDFVIRNIGEEELEVVSIVSSAPELTSNLPAPVTVQPGGEITGSAAYRPLGGPLTATLEFHSNATNGVFLIGAVGFANSPPVIAPIGPISAAAFFPLSFTVTATDFDADPVVLSATAIPEGAVFNSDTGVFSWTPTAIDEGQHSVTFSATDGRDTDTEVVLINVTVLNRPPVAAPGGPYSGAAGAMIQFDGSGSSDPDGDALLFHWEFGDGSSGSGASPTHAYAIGDVFAVTLTVTDTGYGPLSHSAQTTAYITPVTRVLVYSQGWDTPGDLDGWLAETLFAQVSVVNEGGNPNGYLRTYSSPGYGTIGTGVWWGYGSKLPRDYVAARVTRVSFDVRQFSGTFTAIWFRVRKDSSENGWHQEVATAIPSGSWLTFTIDFDPTWSDAEARAAGWTQILPASSFTATMSHADFTSIRIMGQLTYPLLPLEGGIDNFVLEADGVLNHPPIADPGGPYTGAAGAAVQFDGSGSSDADGNSLSYDWNFGDSTTGTGATPTHAYDLGSVYTVTLTVTDDGFATLSHSASTTARISGVQRCGSARPHRVLVDASRSDGVWWSPQGGTAGFDACVFHQGQKVADFLRAQGMEVHELPPSSVVTRSLLDQYRFVIRYVSAAASYQPLEIEAYRDYVLNGGRMILALRFLGPGSTDALAEAFGISFRGAAQGDARVTRFTQHPITHGLTTLPYGPGSGLFGIPAGATILGSLSDGAYIELDFDFARDPEEPAGAPVMGITPHGSGEIFFIGETNPIISLSQPFMSNLIRYFFVRPVSLDVDPDVINLRSEGRWITTFIEATEFGAAEIEPSSVRLEGIAPVEGKLASVSDRDQDGVPALELKFSRDAIASLLTAGNQTLRITGSLLSGGRFEGSAEVRVIDPPGAPLTASVAPNPLNPSGVLTISVPSAGPLKVKLFDSQGRLVRRLIDERLVPAGVRRITFDGRGEGSRALPSGIYFYRVETAGGVVNGRLAIMK